jgi:predicted metal-binding membrane protein
MMAERSLATTRPVALTERAPAPARAHIAIASALLGVAGIAWIVTGLRMAGMDAGPGTDPGSIGFYLVTWMVMMAAMMFPAIAPMVLAHRDLQVRRARHSREGSAQVALFILGYLAVWGTAGLLGYAVLKAGRSLDAGFFAWDRAGRWTAAGVLGAAGLYQLTRGKRECLTRCRGAGGFLLERWRDGPVGSLRMGVEHGVWCLACCWALMAALFALGAMSLTWMLLISILIAVERLLPWRAVATRGVALALAALAIGVAAAPASVPGLTVPGSPAATSAMGVGMGMSAH